MRRIDADELLKTFKEECIGNCEDCKHQCFGGDTTYCELIVIAPTVEVPENAVNCVLTMFGKCSYNETGCFDCEIKDKIRKALNERQQGEERLRGKWEHNKFDEHYCNKCGNFALWLEEADGYYEVESNFCPNCGADMRKNKRMSEEEYLQNVGSLYTDEGYLGGEEE